MTPDLAQALQLLNHYNVRALKAELEALQPGQPRAQAYDTDRTTSGQGPSDPTCSAAINPSAAAADLAAYHRHIDQLYRTCMGLAALADRHMPTHEPRRGTILTETRGCELHRRAGIETHRPAHRSTDLASSLEPKLPQSLPLCMACIDHARTYGRIPTPEELRHHDRTGKWKQRTTGKRVA